MNEVIDVLPFDNVKVRSERRFCDPCQVSKRRLEGIKPAWRVVISIVMVPAKFCAYSRLLETSGSDIWLSLEFSLRLPRAKKLYTDDDAACIALAILECLRSN